MIAVGTTAVRALESAADEQGQRDRHARLDGPGHHARARRPRGRRLLTGFHEPRASHLAMLEAIAGRPHLLIAYQAALAEGYLWHEFGDLHLILDADRGATAGPFPRRGPAARRPLRSRSSTAVLSRSPGAESRPSPPPRRSATSVGRVARPAPVAPKPGQTGGRLVDRGPREPPIAHSHQPLPIPARLAMMRSPSARATARSRQARETRWAAPTGPRGGSADSSD